MLAEASDWLRRRSGCAADWPVETLLGLKGSTTVSVVLPARDEQDTVGTIVAAIRRDLVDRAPLVDEIVVIDSRSVDDTAAVAAAAGAKVFAQDAILPKLPFLSGKGEALWKSLAVTTGDLVVFVDADLLNFSSTFVTGLLGPLLSDPSVSYVKACYDRPYNGGEEAFAGGGRVTELVARPLINLHWPQLAGVVQPLGGEYAGRRSLLERLPFVTGYGVELGLLLDAFDLVGLDAIAQVDLGVREHSHQPTEVLAAMSAQILQTAWSRLDRHGLMMPLSAPRSTLTQFRRGAAGYLPSDRDAAVGERPPMIEIEEYALTVGR
ncbi:glucosyl-3-phosphoglycerate synthase [Actinocorallia sp. API 0066]|uniref:glucosyl-3-phosphoglycerate synthase n=1 Tax=Actinocorallia sp. API 0066 TaxID=2896846 RepID=UPI001E60ABEF|nr:glucosyl-3-phosphoglycerate synthase [Actinocorallia sp. API 0066]MCD0453447.1 glucosyl-3-phosphoglycerate synthase [Actinocorallia sp. API 0066]